MLSKAIHYVSVILVSLSVSHGLHTMTANPDRQDAIVCFARNQFQDRVQASWVSGCFVLSDSCVNLGESNNHLWTGASFWWIYSHCLCLWRRIHLLIISLPTHIPDVNDICDCKYSSLLYRAHWVSTWEQNLYVCACEHAPPHTSRPWLRKLFFFVPL